MKRKQYDPIDDEALYADYFSARGVNREIYHEFKLPKSLKQHLPKSCSSRFLDIGCGMGQFMSALIKLGYSLVHGIDISKAAIKECRSKGLLVDHVTEIVKYKVESEGEKYDVVMMNHVLEHLPKAEIITTLVHIRQRLLKSDGLFYVSVPNAQSSTGCYWAYEDFTHSTLFTAGSLIFVLRSAGFTKVTFLNRDGTDYSSWLMAFLKRILVWYYDLKTQFWNKATGSAFHASSPRIYTFSLQAIAKVDG
jgi:predicted TPR repeat methyltransferase